MTRIDRLLSHYTQYASVYAVEASKKYMGCELWVLVPGLGMAEAEAEPTAGNETWPIRSGFRIG